MFQGRNILISYSICTAVIALYPAHTHKKISERLCRMMWSWGV